MSLTPEQRRRLRAQAHTLKPIVQIGKEGVTQAQLDTIRRGLDHHELIKVRFNEHKEKKHELSTQIAESTSSEQVNLIGNTLTLYKRNPDPSKRKITT